MKLVEQQRKRPRRHAGVKRMVTYGGRPAYQQVADALRREILDGTLAPGAKIPSAADLTRRFQVSKQVADAALSLLRNEGLIYGHQGKGTFVRARPSLVRRSRTWYEASRGAGSPTARSVESMGGTATWDHESEHGTATAEVALRLGVDEGAPVMVTRYVYRSDGTPIQLATSWEPLAVTAGTAIEWPEDSPAVGVVDRFNAIGLQLDAVDEVVWARAPLPEERELLAVPQGVPVMVIERTYSAEGRAVETADIVVPADRYRLHYGIPIT